MHPRAAALDTRAHDPRGASDPPARSAADLPGCLRLYRLRAPGSLARPGPLHPVPRAGPHRSGVSVPRLALPALALWAAVHAAHLRLHAPRPGRRAVGIEGARDALQPRRDRAGGPCRGAHGSFAARGRSVRGPQPGAAGAGGGWRSQRHVDDALAGACAGPDGDGFTRRRQILARGSCPPRVKRAGGGGHRGITPRGPSPSSLQVRGRRARRGCRDQGLGWARASLSRAGAWACTRAPGSARERAGVSRRACHRRGARVRLARVWLRERVARTAAADRGALDPGRDRAPVRPDGAAGMVAQRIRGPLRRGARTHAVAHRARRRLAHAGRLGDARAAPLHRVAVAVVCDLGPTAGRPQHQPPPARGHAPLLRLRPPDPPPARQAAALPAAPPRAQTCPGGET